MDSIGKIVTQKNISDKVISIEAQINSLKNGVDTIIAKWNGLTDTDKQSLDTDFVTDMEGKITVYTNLSDYITNNVTPSSVITF